MINRKLILKLSTSFIFLIISFFYIYKFYYLKISINFTNIHINYYFLIISFICLSIPHFSRTFACITILKLKKKDYFKIFSVLSLQYLLIFLFPFKIGELSIIHLFMKHFKMSFKRSVSLMIFIQLMETASCSIFIAYALLVSTNKSFNNYNILTKVAITGILGFISILIISILFKRKQFLNNKFKFIIEINDILEPIAILKYFIIMVLGWFLAYLSPVFIFSALNYKILYYKGIIGSTIAYAGCESVIKPPLGLGLFHIGWVEIFSLFKISNDICQITGIIAYLTLITIVVLSGVFGFLYLRKVK